MYGVNIVHANFLLIVYIFLKLGVIYSEPIFVLHSISCAKLRNNIQSLVFNMRINSANKGVVLLFLYYSIFMVISYLYWSTTKVMFAIKVEM